VPATSSVPVTFVENKNNVVSLGEKVYGVFYLSGFPPFFKKPPIEDEYIIVNGKKYPLVFNGHRLCSDLKYRTSLLGIAFSGPYSAFSPLCQEPVDVPVVDMKNSLSK